MDLNLTGCRVIVTAGAGGIGLEVARAFVEEGAKVAGTVSAMGRSTDRASSFTGGAARMPQAERSPAAGGISASAHPSRLARSAAWSAPAPPNATSARSAGSHPSTSGVRKGNARR